MEGTTEEQDRIRRGTLLISVLLLLSSVGGYFVYQHFYQPELQVTFVSRKVLPETGTRKKEAEKSSEETKNYSEIKVNQSSRKTVKELEQDPLKAQASLSGEHLKKKTPADSRLRVFRLSDKIEVLP
ncbi:hypothetical protein [Enterococcus sp. AZ196]|uniref:hypothetical protein n=1 Tax=Enterococcus sp. AZ196 TaxID=2774659 RepID=UPI003D2833E2